LTGDETGSEMEMSVKVFINYRREDTAADARLLYDRLAQRFGADNVFLDVVGLQPGTRWLEEIKARGKSSGVVLALIGPRWIGSLTERSQARFENPAEDIVKLELELALNRRSGVEVIPVLVGGATMPPEDKLPRSLRTLSRTHAVELRHAHFDQDVDALLATLEQIASRPGADTDASPPASEQQPAAPSEPQPGVPRATAPPPPPPASSGPYAPDDHHYETVIRFMVDQGTVVPLLGSSVCGTLPDADRIAAEMARRFGIQGSATELPRIAQEVVVSSGRMDLVRALRQILSREPDPHPVHRFLARLPSELERLGLPPQYQMIVTTNYDPALENAFEAENEPYELAVYMATGEHQGKFVHFQWDGDPEPIAVPNRYAKFPIDDYGELQRTVIVKVHGGIGGEVESYGAKENFVVTEDHYIDYLTNSPIESLVPVQILAKLTESHCLFLGYAMRDWYLRVFLKRIWHGEPLGSRSWAIDREADPLEKDFWSQFQVEFFALPLEEYVDQLQLRIAGRAQVSA